MQTCILPNLLVEALLVVQSLGCLKEASLRPRGEESDISPEVDDVMEAAGGAELEAAHAAMDDDGSGKIEFEEFDRWWKIECAKVAAKRQPKGADHIAAAARTRRRSVASSLRGSQQVINEEVW